MEVSGIWPGWPAIIAALYMSDRWGEIPEFRQEETRELKTCLEEMEFDEGYETSSRFSRLLFEAGVIVRDPDFYGDLQDIPGIEMFRILQETALHRAEREEVRVGDYVLDPKIAQRTLWPVKKPRLEST
jgi:hypothetical protein